MNKTIKILLLAFFAFSFLFATSCENTLTITFTGRDTKISYSGKPGDAFLRTISAISGINGGFSESNDGNAGISGISSGISGNPEETGNRNALKGSANSFFDSRQIKISLEQAGFENVNASENQDNSFSVEFSPAKDKSDSISSSGILNHGQNGKPYLEISSEKLQSLYERLPFEIQSYLDMLMAPSFTGEKMSDEEYLDLLASVYGQSLADEIKNSRINFVFIETNENVGTKATLSLLSVLNTEGKITIN